MKKFFPFICLFLILTDISLFFVFRQTPKGEFWKGYSVLYVSKDCPDNYVMNLLVQNDINEFTCRGNQFLPINFPSDSLEVSLIAYNSEAIEYLTKRNIFFFDKSGNFNLFYIPVSFKNKTSQVVSSLNKSGFTAGMDASTSYPFIFPLAVILGIILFTVFSKNKIMFVSGSFLSFLYTLSFPYLSSVISSIVLMLCLFLFIQLYKRKDYLKILSKKISFIILLCFSAVNAFFSSLSAGFSFIGLLLGTVASIFLYDFLFTLKDNKTGFQPVLIRSSKKIKPYNGKERILFPSSMGLIIIVFVFSLFSFDSGNSSSSKKISLPSSIVSSQNPDFPKLQDYYRWNYSVQTFQYRSLNGTSFSDEVSFSRFEENDGHITEKVQVFPFDSNFCDRVYGQIDALPFNAIEKVMKKQGEDFSAGWSVSGSHQNNIYCIIISLMQFILISIYFVGLILKSNRGSK